LKNRFRFSLKLPKILHRTKPFNTSDEENT
jgi:hypothetical protein